MFMELFWLGWLQLVNLARILAIHKLLGVEEFMW